MLRIRNEWGHRGQKAWLPILVGVAIFSVALLPFWAGLVPQAHAAPLTSWNPKVSCTPQVYTIEQIIGTKPNKYGGASNASIFNPGITSSFPPDSTKRWLTPGPTPSGWKPTGPPCTITNVNGTVSAFVQINGVRLNPIIEEDWSTRYDTINGGTAYSNGNQSDTTVNVYTPNTGTCLVVNDTTGGCMHRIHIEIDHDWKAASYCGPSTTCDNSTLHSLTTTDSTPIDIQGFVFWDDGQTSCACHNFSGWELHPLTAWRLSGVSSDFSLGANPNSLTIPPGGSASSKITVSSFNLFSGVMTLSTSVSPPGPGATITPSVVTVPPGGTASSTLNVTTSTSNSGSFDVTVSGNNGTVTRSVVVHVTVLAAFSLSANPGSFPVGVGSSGTSNVSVTSKGGFAGSLHLGITQSGCFNCVSGGISPTDLTLTAGGTASAVLSVTATSWGNATLTITGTSGALSSSTTVIVNAQDFSISSSKTSLTLNFGTTDSSTTINLFSQNHFAGTVTLTSTTKPSGITSSLDRSSVTLTSGGTGSAILSVTGSNPGDYTVTVNATSGFSSHSVTIAVKVLGDFSITSNKNTLTLNPGATDNSVVVLINSSNGLYGTISIATQVSPSGPTATAQFTSLKLTPNGSNATSLTINAGMISGTYKVNVTATFGSLSHSTIITLTIGRATVTIATSLSASTIVAGGSVSDSSTLTGATPNAGGNVTYQVFAGNACTGTPVFSQIVLVMNGVVPSSKLLQFNVTGTFEWQATYSGDPNNNPSPPSPCGSEALTVKQTSTTVATNLSALSIVPGGVVSDSATLTGFFGGFSTGGTATYSVFAGASCTGTLVFTQTVSVNSVNGAVPNSRNVQFNNTGTYQWQVTYSGDANNGVSTSLCGSESLSVGKATPSITTALSANSIVVGNSVADTATITGGTTPTGTVTFTVYSSSACSGTVVAMKTVPLTAGSAGPFNVIFNSTGTFNWQAVYNGDASNNVASSVCGTETLAVGKASPVVAESISATTIIVGNSANANATVSGGFNPAGTVAFSVFTGSSCSGSILTSKTMTLATGTAGPFSVIFNSTGTFNWQAVYNGDANNNPNASPCKSVVVNKATPVITTALSSTSIAVGSSVSDTASMTSSFQAGGTVTYSFFGGSTCSGTGTPVGSPVTVTGGVIPSSTTQPFNTAGSYSWNAVYSGDANNGPATSPCEPLTVNKANPTIATVLSQNVITVGSSVTDSATLTNGFQAGGTVTYSLFSGSTCGGTATVVGSPVTVATGVVPNSASQTFNTAGSFSWNAVYSGDANNNIASSACEPLTVNPKGVAIATSLSSTTITVGGPVFDSAALTGATSNAGGTVTYNLFTSGTCSGPSTVVSTVTVTNAIVPNSASQTFSTAGSFSWNAVYSGDSNNSGAPSACEPLTVNKTNPTITISLSANPITVGQSITDSATLTGSFQAGGSVNYLQFSTGSCSGSSTIVSTVTVTSNVIPSSSTINPVPSGTYGFEASYSGDANNGPITSSCSSLTVNKAGPGLTTSLSQTTIPVGSSVTDSATMTGGYQPSGSVAYSYFTGGSCTGTATSVGSPVTVTNGVVPSSSSQGFNSAGSYSWSAVYGGDANNNAITSPCEPLTVNKASPFITTALSQNPITVGGSVSDFATLTGGFQAGGSATYFLFSTADCTGSKNQVSIVTVSNGVIPSSSSQTFSSAGLASWNVAYSGDVNNNASTSPCELLTVNKASPTISTTLSQNVITVGSSVSDSATMANGFQASGAVTYSFFSGSMCGGSATLVGSPVTVASGIVPNSASQPFNTAGSYSWIATYGGDANNNAATSACEPLTVNPKGVAITTSLSSTTIVVGGSAYDSAVLTGATTNAGGTITYNLFSNGICSGTFSVVSQLTVVSSTVPNSRAVIFNSTAAFSWNAGYSGDANNAPATSVCEPLTINKASPTTATTVSAASATVGSALHDSATLAGAYNPRGTVTYTVFSNNACSGNGASVGNPVVVAGGTVPDSVSITPSPAGPYSFQASYSGDANNNPVSSACEPFSVSKASPTISTALTTNPIAVGGSTSDSATVAGGFSPGGTVTYSYFQGSVCAGPGTTVGLPVTMTSGLVPSSSSQTFSSAGPYSWNVVYNGDANNNAVASACEPLTVNKASPAISTTLSANPITVGGSVSDSATMTGGFQAGGTVTYDWFTGSTCGGTANIVSAVGVVSGGIPSSAARMFNSAGPYSWNAVYSGDADNNGSPSSCEPLTVNPTTGVTISTTISSSSITVGGSVTDSATLAGITSGAGGTVTYNSFQTASCTGTPAVVSTVTVINGAAPGSAAKTYASAGSFSWNAVYSGDANNGGAPSACESLAVNQAAPSITTTVSSNSVPVGTSIHDSATLSNGFNAAGTVTYTVFSDAGCTLSGVVIATVSVTNGVVPDSSGISPTPSGSYGFQASYSGDANNKPATGVCEPFNVQKVSPAITTSLSLTTIPVGSSVFDSATMTGGYQPGGSVTYAFFLGSSCTGTSTTVGSPIAVTNGLVPSSISQTFSSASAYSWSAIYSGDANNNPITSLCEPLTVSKASPAISTTLSANPITVGGSVYDSATMAGAFQAGGSATYFSFTTPDCTGSSATVSTVTVNNGAMPSSNPLTFSSAGSFSWNAHYFGDSNNNASTSPCEPLTVNKASPMIGTTLSQNVIVVGGSVSDSATITNSFQAGGTVTYDFYAGSTCSGAPTVVGTPVTVTNGVTPSSASQTFNTAGQFSWNAGYSGDANNNVATGACEPLTVNPKGVAIGTSLTPATITVGGSTFDSAVLTGATGNAAGTVMYNLYSSGICSGSTSAISKVTVASSTIPNSRSVIFNSTSPFSWNAVYSGDANNAPATSLCEPLTVNKATPTLSTAASATSATIGTSFHDSATLTGAFNGGGTVSYSVFSNNACSGNGTPVGSPVNVAGGIVPDSVSITPSPAGPYSFQASYGGDGNNNGASSPCEPFVINKISPTVTTTLSANLIAVGGSVSDSAAITGGFSLGGTVTYNYFQNSNCAAPGTNVGLSVTISNGLVPSSSSQTFSLAGPYSWNAVYNGDANNNAVTSACEPLTVNKASPTITTTLSQNSITVGGSVFDSATLASSFQAGGSVTYDVFTGGTCNGALTVLPTVTVTSGFVPNSVSQIFNSAGPYSWNAFYSGDSNNNAATSACEPLTVNPTSGTAISTSLSISAVNVGGLVTDSATLTGVTSGAGGTISYYLFQTASCTGTPGLVSTVTVTNGIVPNSASRTFNTAGSFSWNAIYSGDANNGGATSVCEPLTVNQASPSIATAASGNNIPVGNPVHDSATLSNGFNAGGTVAYTLFPNLVCAGSGTVISTVSVTMGVIPDSSATSPVPAGSYGFQASYSGDQNNKATTGACEPFIVIKASPTITTSLSTNSIVVGSSVTASASMTGGFQSGGTVTYTLYTGNSCSGISTPVSTVTVSNSAIPSSGPASPSSAGPSSLNAAYGGDANNNPVTGACVGLVVNLASPTVANSLSSSSVSAGGSASDSAAISGGFQAGGTVTYNVFGNLYGGACSGTPIRNSLKPVSSGIASSSDSQLFSEVGLYGWNIVYSGDSNNNLATSSCAVLSVAKTLPTITSTLSSPTIGLGNPAHDSAILAGSFQAGGTVTYSFFSGSTCAGPATVVGAPVAVANGVVPNSASQTFNTAGQYSWNAAYGGDTNNNAATSACEPLFVTLKGPSITSTLSAMTITVGGSVFDSATLTGASNTAGGTVTYNFFITGTCSGSPSTVSVMTVTNAVVPNSRSVTFNSTATFSWNAIYSGDINNAQATGQCNPLMINKATPVLFATLSANPITKGGSASVSSTLTGGFRAGGTVTYSMFSSADCTGNPTVVSTVTVNNNVAPPSASQTFPTDGKFGWKVAYGGDSNNNQATSPCSGLDVTTPPLLFVPDSQTINPGSTIHFVVNATDSSWNNITITASGLPSGAVFPGAQSFTGKASSVFSWKPSDAQASADYKVTFTVDDGHGGKTSSHVTIHVAGISQTPPLNNAISYFVVALVAGTAVVLAAPLLLRRFRK